MLTLVVFCPLGGMVSDAEDLAWSPCSITSATRAWTAGLPVQPCRSSVTLFARVPASQGSEEELNVLCNIASIRPMYILITAICPGFWVRGQIPPEVVFFVPCFFSSLISSTERSAKKRRSGHRGQIPGVETVRHCKRLQQWHPTQLSKPCSQPRLTTRRI